MTVGNQSETKEQVERLNTPKFVIHEVQTTLSAVSWICQLVTQG
jgi:hypothetical protein